jgi:(2Fe-2S) ferredoxin
MKYEKHIFICNNQKAEGKKCCGDAHGMELVEAFKKELQDRGLNRQMRAQRTGCLDICGLGPALVVYPEGVFYGNVQLSDVTEIVEQHLVNNQPVERLKLDL